MDLRPTAPQARAGGASELTPRWDDADWRRGHSMPHLYHSAPNQVGSDLTALAEKGPLGKIPTTLQTKTVPIRFLSPEKLVTTPQTSSIGIRAPTDAGSPRDEPVFTLLD